MQADVASKHQSIDKLQSKIQSLSDLLVQARYNHSHDLPVTAQEAAAGKTPDEQVHPAMHIYSNVCLFYFTLLCSALLCSALILLLISV